MTFVELLIHFFFFLQSNTLKVSGYLRGLPLSVNGLVHIPGFGDFQMSKIVAVTDPYTIPKEQHGEEKEIPIVTEILAEADPTIQVFI